MTENPPMLSTYRPPSAAPLRLLGLVALLLAVALPSPAQRADAVRPGSQGVTRGGDEFRAFLAPLERESGPLVLTRTETGLALTRGARTLHILTSTTAAANLTSGLLSPKGWLPALGDGLWGYADEVVFGQAPRPAGRDAAPGPRILLGLVDRRTALVEDAVLKSWQSWIRGLDTRSPVPALDAVASARITPDTVWTLSRAAALLATSTRTLPEVRNLDGTLAPSAGGFTARVVGMRIHPTPTPVQGIIAITPRAANQPPLSVLNQSSNAGLALFTFTTDSWTVRVEVTPSSAVSTTPSDWIAAFRSLDR